MAFGGNRNAGVMKSGCVFMRWEKHIICLLCIFVVFKIIIKIKNEINNGNITKTKIYHGKWRVFK